ncbi:MAG: hypothetical protein ABI612_05325 [Betaproteobacteria bacterium]
MRTLLAKISRRISTYLRGVSAKSRFDPRLSEVQESLSRDMTKLISIQESFARDMGKFIAVVGYHHPAHFPLLDLSSMLLLQISDFCERNLYQNTKYKSTKRITHYQKKIYSVKAEDGVLEEIFNRIGTTDRSFVEFGVGHKGEENNSLICCLKAGVDCGLKDPHRSSQTMKPVRRISIIMAMWWQ